MGLINEYTDKAVQTEPDAVPSPYADPAVVLAAPLVSRLALGQERHHSTPASSPIASGSPFIAPQSPVSPMLSPVISRRAARRRHARCPAGEMADRRIVSMPEAKGEVPALSNSHGKRVVSMPDRLRPPLEPSAELSQSVSTAANESFGSYGGRRERVRVFRPPSDVPQTPSPPSSPESLLIIAAGTQLPEGFLRRKYSPEPLIEEDEDWITWANSPPRPIPALHGPLSLPYARCPSGAEGTIIEEPDNVAQMIWGLGPDDQPHHQVRAEGPMSHPDDSQSAPFPGLGQPPHRLQKKRNSTSTTSTQQFSKAPRVQVYPHTTHGKQSVSRTQRRNHDDDKHSSSSQVKPDSGSESHQVTGVAWNNSEPSMPPSIGVPVNPMIDADVLSIDDNRVLGWQFARLRQALRTSLADMDAYGAYPGRLEPVFPAAVASGIPSSQSYPRIFVEPRPNELAGSATAQSPIEIAQQCRQQYIYKQAFQKQKSQMRNILPTPPNSSSPQWSSHFSPYLTCRSTFSPELAGSTDHLAPLPSQKYRTGVGASQYLWHTHDRDEHNDFDTSAMFSSAKTPVPNINPASLRQSSSSSSTLAKYIKQLRALSPIAHFSSFQQPQPSDASPLPLSLADGNTIDTLQNVFHSPVISMPPSPESPQTLSRPSPHHTANARFMPAIRSMQRRLSTLPEEDSVSLELSTSVSSHKFHTEVATDSNLSSHKATTGNQIHSGYLERPLRNTCKPDAVDFDNSLGAPSIAFQETSPAKVRLPSTKGNNNSDEANDCPDTTKGGRSYRRKHRFKKVRGPATVNEQESLPGLVGHELTL